MLTVDTPGGPGQVQVQVFDLPSTFPIILPICRALGIGEVVDRLCPMHHCAALTHGDVCEMLALHILREPARQPLYKLDEWAAENNVDQLYDCAPEAFNDDRVGRTLEALSEKIPQIETELVSRAIERFHVPIDAIHWDLTNVTFTGAYDNVPMIDRGYGNGRLHEKQLQVSLHTSHVGAIPLRHELLSSSAHQAPLASPMLKDLQRRLPPSRLLIVSDCGGISYDNIVAYNKAKALFLGPMEMTPAEKQFVADTPDDSFVELSHRSKNKPKCVYSCRDTTLTIERQKRKTPLKIRALVMHSTGKHKRDADERQKKIDKVLERLAYIESRLNKSHYCHEKYAREQLDKAINKAPGLVQYELTGEYKQLQLRYWIDDQAVAEAARSDGRWLMVTNDRKRGADELFKLQRGQYDIEARFRNLGHDLAVQPVWLHKEERIRGLLLVFVIALMVYCLLELRSERVKLEGDHYEKMTARQLLYKFSSAKIVKVRVPDRPPQMKLELNVDHQRILSRLGFPDPDSYLLTDLATDAVTPQRE